MPTPESLAIARELLAFVDSSPTPFQVVSAVSKRLQNAGFVELKEVDGWAAKGLIKQNGKVSVRGKAKNNRLIASFFNKDSLKINISVSIFVK